jgi:hypothetical protein
MKLHGFSKVRSFAQKFGLLTQFCGFSAQLALARHTVQVLSSDLGKTIDEVERADLVTLLVPSGHDQSNALLVFSL